MTPLISEIAALGLSSPKLQTHLASVPQPLLEQRSGGPSAAVAPDSVPVPVLHVRDPHHALFQQRLLLTAYGSPAAAAAAPIVGAVSTGGAPAVYPGVALAGSGADMDLTALAPGGGRGGVSDVASGHSPTGTSAWQRELGLDGGSGGGGGTGSGGAGGSGVGADGGERDMRILATVAKSLDFDALLAMQVCVSWQGTLTGYHQQTPFLHRHHSYPLSVVAQYCSNFSGCLLCRA